MRIKLKLMSNFPHVQTVGLSFLEKPTFDYVLKPLTGFDINNIPGLSSFVQDQVHAILGPMMYDPNVFTLNLEQLLNGAPLDTAIGVLQLTITSARGLKANKIGGGAPDPVRSDPFGRFDRDVFAYCDVLTHHASFRPTVRQHLARWSRSGRPHSHSSFRLQPGMERGERRTSCIRPLSI